MALLALSKKDILRRLNRANITGLVKNSQALEAAKLFINSELPDLATRLEPIFIRQHVLVIRSDNSLTSHALKTKEQDLLTYIKEATGVRVDRIQFRA